MAHGEMVSHLHKEDKGSSLTTSCWSATSEICVLNLGSHLFAFGGTFYSVEMECLERHFDTQVNLMFIRENNC